MKKLFILPLLLSLSPLAIAFEGKYECTGNDARTQKPFTLTQILKKTGETYSLDSRTTEGDVYHGTGIVDKANNSLSVAAINPADPKETGIIVFHSKNKDTLDATWTYLDEKTVVHATCKKMG